MNEEQRYKLAQDLANKIEEAVRDLDDDDYLYVLEDVSAHLDASIEAKRDEMEEDS